MTIRKTFPGNRYNVIVEADTTDGYFEVSAIHKSSGRQSAVTNINTVISEILEPILKIGSKDVETSIWISDNIKHGRLVKWAIRCLKNKHWVINYLEGAFDEDMELGGWNSKILGE
jgi:hypothetical protein